MSVTSAAGIRIEWSYLGIPKKPLLCVQLTKKQQKLKKNKANLEFDLWSLQSPKALSQLYCYYKRDRPFLILAPIKVSEASTLDCSSDLLCHLK